MSHAPSGGDKRPRGSPDMDDADSDDEGGVPASKKFRPGGANGASNGGGPAPSLDEDEDEAAEVNNGYKQSVDLSIGGSDAWKRPPLAHIDEAKDNIAFQLTDIDYLLADVPEPGARVGVSPTQWQQKQAVLRLYGVNDAGNSVLAYVHNFMRYFYVPVPPGASVEFAGNFGPSLNAALKESGHAQAKLVQVCVLRVQRVRKQSVWGYHFKEMGEFLQVTLALPDLVPLARRLCEKGLNITNAGYKSFSTYETTLPYTLRFMVDNSLRGGGWVELPAGQYKRKKGERLSHCQLELDVDHTQVKGHDPEGPWSRMAPMRILSFDIECAGRKGHFPKADTDPVIQIASCVALQAAPSVPIIKNVFTLRGCAAIAGAQVIPNESEKDMLMGWLQFFVQADPDIITGYNIINFDLPYLLDRAKALGVRDFPFLGRLRNSLTTMKNSKFESKAVGIRESKDIKIEGRIQFDCLDVIRREHKLRSYTLNAVCAEFLGAQKEDVHYSIISELQNGTDETRRRLAVYCLKDSLLPLQLIGKLMLLINAVEMARVTGVPITYLLTRGQQIKVVSQLYRKARQHSLLIPVRRFEVTDEKYVGGAVLDPETGYYSVPIATLDFASLYPSIMMAHNLCYSTLLNREQLARLKPEEYTQTPLGDCFVKPSVHKGLLPEILTELLDARSRAKKMMKNSKDPFEAAVLNGRQLALKISANSVYGFTGAQVGQLPCLQISSSVTAFGRTMIERTAQAVTDMFKVGANVGGIEVKHDAKVIYGDTDSVMVKFGTTSVAESMELGKVAAQEVSKLFISPIKLEFEKVYFPYLLMNKKRYAGLYWTNPNVHDKMDTKGIETVRRDNCSLVSNVVTQCLNYILIDRSVDLALSYCQNTIRDLLTNRLDLSLLVISKSLGKSADAADYASKQAHVELAARMKARDPRSAPVVGDRVAYVITRGAKDAKAHEKAEDPLYVLEHGVPIDTHYYLQNQLQQPLMRIFEPIMGEGKANSLFTGAHTLGIKVSTPTTGGIASFAVVKRTCLGCRALLTPEQKVVCAHCAPRQGQLYVRQVERVRQHEELFTRVWTQCQRCQGALHQDVLCTSADCPIFYRRMKVQKDLNEAQVALDKFSF